MISLSHRKIAKNAFFLSALNGINIIFPVLLVPFLIKTVGVDNNGRWAFSQAVIAYFILIVNYGFDFSGTRKIAAENSPDERIEIFSSITFSRILLALVSCIVFSGLIIFIPFLKRDALLHFMGIGIILGQAFNSQWVFQAFQDMKYVTLMTFISRMSSTLLILMFIKRPTDYQFINLFFSLGYIISGAISYFLCTSMFKLKLRKQCRHKIYLNFVEAWHIFLSTLSMNLYRNSNVLLLGVLSDFHYVTVYSTAEKIIKSFQSIVNPIAQALFPHFSERVGKGESVESLKRALYKSGFALSIIAIPLIMFITTFASIIVKLYIGEGFEKVALNIKIMSPVILLGGLNYLLGLVGLVNLHKDKEFLVSVFISGITSIIILIAFGSSLKDTAACIAMLLSEVILLVFNFYHLSRIHDDK